MCREAVVSVLHCVSKNWVHIINDCNLDTGT